MDWNWFSFVLITFASFRLTRLIVFDKIASFIRTPFLETVEEAGEAGETITYWKPKGTGLRYWIGELFSCYWCTGIWSALILYLGNEFMSFIFQPVTFILAIAALAGIMEHLLD